MSLAPQPRREWRWFLAIAVVLLVAGIGLRDPWPADEPRFVLVARQMWESGQWLFPHRGHEFYPDKPPLYFWLLGAAHAVVRNWRWSFLLPSLFAALGTLWLAHDLARRLWSARAGLWAAIATFACLQFIYQAKRAQIDPTVVFFITLGVYGIVRHVLLGPAWRWYWIGCFAAGLGVITKGVGFLALLALLPYAWMRWRDWPGLAPLGRGNGWKWALGAAAFLGAICIWFVPMVLSAQASGDPAKLAYMHEILFRQTATRYANAWHHTQPPWYFIGVIAAFWMPFSLALPWLAPRWRNAWKSRDPKVWLPLAWSLLVLAFFSASPGKRDMYILPMLPMVAVAAAPYLEAIVARKGFRRALFTLAALLGLAFLVAGALALWSDPAFEFRIETERGLPAADDRLWWLLAVVGAVSLAALATAWRWGAARASALSLAVVVLLLFPGASVLLDAENSSRATMQQARALAGDAEIGLVAWREQNLLQAVGPTTEFGFRVSPAIQWQRGLAWLRARPQDRTLFVLETALPACVDRARAKPVGTANRRSWWLVGAISASGCAADAHPADTAPREPLAQGIAMRATGT